MSSTNYIQHPKYNFVKLVQDGRQGSVYLVLIDTPYPDDGISACCKESV